MVTQNMQVLTSAKTTEWYTPPEYIEMAREVLGRIELDPCSSRLAQSYINAGCYHKLNTSGIDFNLPDKQLKAALKATSRIQMQSVEGWYGNVWLNPPFDNTSMWIDRLTAEYEKGRIPQAIALVNSNLGYRWFEKLWREHSVCFCRERISFLNHELKTVGQSKQGQAFVYFGDDDYHFKTVFSTIGRVVRP